MRMHFATGFAHDPDSPYCDSQPAPRTPNSGGNRSLRPWRTELAEAGYMQGNTLSKLRASEISAPKSSKAASRQAASRLLPSLRRH